jgi:predicted AAA+ superfamily ATPase
MEYILLKSQLKFEHTSLDFRLNMFDQLNKDNQLMAILGARVVGKTNLLLQHAKEFNGNSLYVSSGQNHTFFC